MNAAGIIAMLLASLFLLCIFAALGVMIVSKFVDLSLYRKYRRDSIRMRHIVKELRNAKRYSPQDVDKILHVLFLHVRDNTGLMLPGGLETSRPFSLQRG